jgi:hypothetical protein
LRSKCPCARLDVGTEELAERLSAIAGELEDLAFDRLREASASIGEDEKPDGTLLEEEKRLTRARRSVEKAITALRGPTAFE